MASRRRTDGASKPDGRANDKVGRTRPSRLRAGWFVQATCCVLLVAALCVAIAWWTLGRDVSVSVVVPADIE